VKGSRGKGRGKECKKQEGASGLSSFSLRAPEECAGWNGQRETMERDLMGSILNREPDKVLMKGRGFNHCMPGGRGLLSAAAGGRWGERRGGSKNKGSNHGGATSQKVRWKWYEQSPKPQRENSWLR